MKKRFFNPKPSGARGFILVKSFSSFNSLLLFIIILAGLRWVVQTAGCKFYDMMNWANRTN